MFTAPPDGVADAVAPCATTRHLASSASSSIEFLVVAPDDICAYNPQMSAATHAAAASPKPAADRSVTPSIASASEGHPPGVTYTLALVSDYRRGGVSKSRGKPALQGGIDVSLSGRWNFGVRGSSIAEHGNVELVLYGAKTIEIADTDLSFGVSALTFPRAPHADYISVQTSAARTLGPIDATVAVNYTPSQDNLHGEDNLYIVARARTPVGTILGAPVTLGASLGQMRGRFAMAHSRCDWSLSLTGRVHGLDIGVSYIDNDLGGRRGDPTAVFSLAHSF